MPRLLVKAIDGICSFFSVRVRHTACLHSSSHFYHCSPFSSRSKARSERQDRHNREVGGLTSKLRGKVVHVAVEVSAGADVGGAGLHCIKPTAHSGPASWVANVETLGFITARKSSREGRDTAGGSDAVQISSRRDLKNRKWHCQQGLTL